MTSGTEEKSVSPDGVVSEQEMAPKDVVGDTEAPANFPKIRRLIWDVYHDDERNEIWVGIKCRFTAKGRTRENGPIEDVEMNHDGMSVVTSLDAAKQEALIALARDGQMLNEKRQRQNALKGNGILDRLTAGLGRAIGAGKSILTH